MTIRVGALVLAAGFSRRFGGSKLTAQLNNGLTVFAQTLANVQAALPDVIVVTRPEMVEALLADCDSVQVFDGADQGMGATLAYGAGLVADWDACLVCLADMPFIQPATYAAIAASCATDRIVLPTCDAQSGNPAGFGRDYYPDLMQLSGDSGGKSVIKRHGDALLQLPVADPAIMQDIDTPQQLQQWQSGQ